MRKFKQENPASRFGEAYPVGNGQMGAVVYGSFPLERITFSENTFFSGSRSRENNQPGAAEAFGEMRELICRGEYEKAQEAAKRFHGVRHNYGTNLPVGDLMITYGKQNACEQEKPAEYSRSLDFGSGIAQVEFQMEGTRIREEVFASHPDHVLVWHMKSSAKTEVSVQWRPYHGNGSMESSESGFLYSARALETVHCDEPCGVSLYGRCEVQTDGTRIWNNDSMQIASATEITLYFYCRTDYRNLMEEVPKADSVAEAEIRKFLKKQSADVLQKKYETVKKRHVEDVTRLMSRVELTLEGEAEDAAEMFQYGRYLLLSSSREDSLLPAHLQGIWNDDVACRIGWTCDMHLDINTQMNYWPADITGIPETLPPLARWMEKLAESGRQSAMESYGLKGWTAELVSNAWCFSAPYWAAAISPYPTGGAWLLANLWEHCIYADDREMLKETVYPLMQEAVRFFADYVFREEDGRVGCGPSISAENSFLYHGRPLQISNSCTYEITVIRELFTRYLEFSEQVKPDEVLAERVREILPQLPPFRIMEDGTLAEWEHDYPAADSQHRHTSHLLGLYPFAQITPENTPSLASAAEASIRAKLTPYDQWEDTGWARSLLILYTARLHNGEQAWFHIKSMLGELLEPNGLIYHPPTRGTVFDDDFGHVYELDGNTGLTSGIAEMLLQSHNGVVQLLPALPKEWEKGHVKGLCARNGIRTEIYWEHGEITEYRLLSQKDQQCMVRYGDFLENLSLKAGILCSRKPGSRER